MILEIERKIQIRQILTILSLYLSKNKELKKIAVEEIKELIENKPVIIDITLMYIPNVSIELDVELTVLFSLIINNTLKQSDVYLYKNIHRILNDKEIIGKNSIWEVLKHLKK